MEISSGPCGTCAAEAAVSGGRSWPERWLRRVGGQAEPGRCGAHQLALLVLDQARLVRDEDCHHVRVAALEEGFEQLDVLRHRRLHRVRIAELKCIVRDDGNEAMAAVHGWQLQPSGAVTRARSAGSAPRREPSSSRRCGRTLRTLEPAFATASGDSNQWAKRLQHLRPESFRRNRILGRFHK